MQKDHRTTLLDIPAEAAFARLAIISLELGKLGVILTGLLPLGMLILTVMTGNSYIAWLAPFSVMPSLALHADVDAMVRRQWTLYVRLTGQQEANPHPATRAVVGLAHLYALVFQMVVVATSTIITADYLSPEYGGYYYAALFLALGSGAALVIYAAAHQPKFAGPVGSDGPVK